MPVAMLTAYAKLAIRICVLKESLDLTAKVLETKKHK